MAQESRRRGPATRVVLVTRFGLGQTLDTFYNINLPLLKEVLFPSIQRQGSKDFDWILLTDQECPSWVLAELNKMANLFPGLFIYQHSPFSTYTLLPDIPMVLRSLGFGAFERIATVRVDSDDALSFDFVKIILQKIRVESIPAGPSLLLFPRGSYLFLQSRKAALVDKRDYSVLGVLDSFSRKMWHCYSREHSHFSKEVANELSQIEIGGESASWMRTVRPFSEVRSHATPLISRVLDLLPVLRLLGWFVKKKVNRNFPTVGRGLLSPSQLERVFGFDARSRLPISLRRATQIPFPIPPEIVRLYGPGNRLSVKQEILVQLKHVTHHHLSLGEKADASRLKGDFYSF